MAHIFRSRPGFHPSERIFIRRKSVVHHSLVACCTVILSVLLPAAGAGVGAANADAGGTRAAGAADAAPI